MASVHGCVVCGSRECQSWQHLSKHESARGDAWMRKYKALEFAAKTLLDEYIQLAESGDAGQWNPHEQIEAQLVKRALGIDGPGDADV